MLVCVVDYLCCEAYDAASMRHVGLSYQYMKDPVDLVGIMLSQSGLCCCIVSSWIWYVLNILNLTFVELCSIC